MNPFFDVHQTFGGLLTRQYNFLAKRIFSKTAHVRLVPEERVRVTVKRNNKNAAEIIVFRQKMNLFVNFMMTNVPQTFWADPILRFLKNDVCSGKEAMSE